MRCLSLFNHEQGRVVTSGLAKVDFVRTKVTGKPKTSGGAKVTGAI